MDAHKEELLPLSWSERFSAIPGVLGIHLEEQASYEVVDEVNGIEIRLYDACTRMQVEVMDKFDEAKEVAFTKLANYLHGKNDGGAHMVMTTPVLNGPGVGGGWKMAFFLPEAFAETAPAPLDPAISVERFDSRLYAAITYSGNVTEELMVAKNSELLKALVGTHYRPNLAPVVAQYDQPFAIPFLKTNEAMVEVIRDR